MTVFATLIHILTVVAFFCLSLLRVLPSIFSNSWNRLSHGLLLFWYSIFYLYGKIFRCLKSLLRVNIEIRLAPNGIYCLFGELASCLVIRAHTAFLLLDFDVLVFLLKLTMLQVFLKHLLELHLLLLQRLLLALGFQSLHLPLRQSLGELQLLLSSVLLGRGWDQGMKEGLLIERHVLTSMRINVMGFKVVVIDKAICFVADILMPIILEALAIEIFTKARIR